MNSESKKYLIDIFWRIVDWLCLPKMLRAGEKSDYPERSMTTEPSKESVSSLPAPTRKAASNKPIQSVPLTLEQQKAKAMDKQFWESL